MTQNSNSTLLLTFNKFLTENRRTLIVAAGGYLGFCILYGFWISLMGIFSAAWVPIYLIVTWVGSAVAASMMFHSFTTKEGKINTLMNPASAADKFLVRLAVLVVGTAAMTVAGYFLMGVASTVSRWVFQGELLWLNTPYSLQNDFQGWVMLAAAFLMNEMLFFFGGVLWPRRSFLKTLLAIIGVQMVFSFVLAAIVKIGWFPFNMAFNLNPNLGVWFLTAAIYAFDVLLAWGAYYKFKRATI